MMRVLFPRHVGRHRAGQPRPVPVVVCGHGLTRCDCMPNPDVTQWIRPGRETRS